MENVICQTCSFHFYLFLEKEKLHPNLSDEENSFVFYFLTCLIVKLDRPVDLPALLGDVKLDLKLLLPHVIAGTQTK